jgi:hypothetical protein
MADATIEYLLRIRDEASQALKDLGEEAGEAERKLQGADKGTQSMTASMVKATAVIGAAKAAFVALRAATVDFTAGAVSVGAQMESFETKLTTLLGSSEAASDRISQLFEIGSTTPFALDQLVAAEIKLEAFGVTGDRARTAVMDLAAFMDGDLIGAADAVGRAFQGGAGAADILRDRGVLAMVELQAGIKPTELTLEQFRKTLIDTLTDPQGKIAGGTDKLAATFDGLMSNLSDAWFRFQKNVADADLFSTSKATLRAFLDFMVENQGVIDDFAAAIGRGIGGGLKNAAMTAAFMIDSIRLAARELESFAEKFKLPEEMAAFFELISPDKMDLVGLAFGETIESMARWALAIDEVTGASDKLTEGIKKQGEEVLGTESAVLQLEKAFKLIEEQGEKFGDSPQRGVRAPSGDGDGDGEPAITGGVLSVETVRLETQAFRGGAQPDGTLAQFQQTQFVAALGEALSGLGGVLSNALSSARSLAGGSLPGMTWWGQAINLLAEFADPIDWGKLEQTIHDAFVGAVRLFFDLDAIFGAIVDGVVFGIQDAFSRAREGGAEPTGGEAISGLISRINETLGTEAERSFQIGTKFVDQTGLALLHRGEQVVPANGAMPSNMQGFGGGGGLVVNVNAPLGIGPGTAEQLVRELNSILGARGLNLAVT